MSNTLALRGRDIENAVEAARGALIRTGLDAATVVRARTRLTALVGGAGDIGVDWRTGPETAMLVEIAYAVVAAHPGISPSALAAVLAAIEELCPPLRVGGIA